MKKERLTAFSDGVIAIIITIMVLELKPPHGDQWSDLFAITPIFLGYLLSFIYVAIYWNNHHHLLMTVDKVNAPILWANMNLLFWLSLIPFATAWLDEHHFSASAPAAFYGLSLLMPAIGYNILQKAIVNAHGPDSVLLRALGPDTKGKLSIVAYLLAFGLAFVTPAVAELIYVGVALMWLIPDPRIERTLASTPE